MSTRLTIEDESGTITRPRHPHNGYYAGDFSRVTDAVGMSAARAGLVIEQRTLVTHP